jgi:glycosyltransferase involved in cell wall biosynthesis
MRLLYLTMKGYPPKTADHVYVLQLCRALSKIADTTLVVRTASPEIADVKTIEVPMVTKLRRRFGRTLSFAWWFLRFVRADRERCRDCVFIVNDFNLMMVVVAFRVLFRFPYRIMTDMHLMTDSFKDTLAVRGSDYVLATSKTLAGAIERKFPSARGKVHVVYGGVDYAPYEALRDTDKVALRRELRLPENKILFGYIGYFKVLKMEKGIHTMVEALPHLSKEYALVCVGARRNEKEIYGVQAASLGVTARSLIIDAQPHHVVPKYLRAMDVIVIPYLNAPHFRRYGFPMKVWEYLASGVPIVYARLPVIEEVLEGKGVAFKPGDPVSLAEAVQKAASHPAHPSREAEYSWDAKAQRILSILQSDSAV